MYTPSAVAASPRYLSHLILPLRHSGRQWKKNVALSRLLLRRLTFLRVESITLSCREIRRGYRVTRHSRGYFPLTSLHLNLHHILFSTCRDICLVCLCFYRPQFCFCRPQDVYLLGRSAFAPSLLVDASSAVVVACQGQTQISGK
jgi:hypothetical protein